MTIANELHHLKRQICLVMPIYLYIGCANTFIQMYDMRSSLYDVQISCEFVLFEAFSVLSSITRLRVSRKGSSNKRLLYFVMPIQGHPIHLRLL